jgi:hypothetical protein
VADETVGPVDRHPMPGLCNRGKPHWETRVYRYGPVDAPTLLCRTHIVALIKVATWPDPPRSLGGG